MRPSALAAPLAWPGQASGVVADPGQAAGVKVVFANQLRAVAALSVMLSHWGGVYILMGPLVGWITSTPVVDAGRPAILRLTMLPDCNFGAFGVAIFFLISGFVIPFSLRAQPAGAFLVARVWRIFPTLCAALLLEWLAVFGQSRLYGRAMAYPVSAYLWNACLLDTTVGSGYVDLVNWTLAIEVKFYLLMALLRPMVLAGRLLPLFGWSLAALAVALAQRHGWLPIGDVLANEPMSIGFMLIGVVFHYRLEGRIGAARGLGAGLALAVLFLLCWRFGPNRGLYPDARWSYLYALALFLSAYAARGRFRPRRWLDAMADISYPFYLIHSIIGYSAMTFATVHFGFGYAEAVPFAAAIVLPLAWLLHQLVERPSTRLGKHLARSMGGARQARR